MDDGRDDSDSDGKLCTCLVAGRVRCHVGDDRGGIYDRARARAARAVGIANAQPRLDELYMLASYTRPSPILKRTYSQLDTLVQAAHQAVTVHWH